MDYQTKEFIQNIIEQKGEGNAQIVIRGSSIKMCLVAEGSADFYPRMASVMEWDIAAGHAICEAADCAVTGWNGEKLTYNKEDFRMPWFKIANKKAKGL
jgi:3'(2'), 5'-bisphosphate nucleotidase